MAFSGELAKLLHVGELFKGAADENNILFLYLLNDVRFNEAMNSIATLRTNGGRTNVLLFALDTLVCPHVQRLNLNIPCIWFGVDLPESTPWYGESDLIKHWKLTMLALRKFVLIALALAWGFSAWFVDTDTVFLQDPYVELTGNYDLWIQDGSRGCRDISETCKNMFGFYSKTCNASWEYNTGFMFWRSSRRTRRFATQLLYELDGIFTHGRLAQIYDDQILLSFFIHHGSGIDLDLSVKVLPRLRYPHGNLFFDERLCIDKDATAGPSSWRERCCGVVMVHNNFLFDPNGDEKTRRLQTHGLWYSDSSKLQCCPRPPAATWRPLLADGEAGALPPLPLPFASFGGSSASTASGALDVAVGGDRQASTVLRLKAGWTYVSYLDLVRAVRAGHLVVLELGTAPVGGDAAATSAKLPEPKVAEFLWRTHRFPVELEVVVDPRAWLFLPTPRCASVLAEWLRPQDDSDGDGLPPLGSLRARLRFPALWGTIPTDDQRQLYAARACQEVPCW
eukprot:TRINITY_DN28546_c0_g2_i1.p1 TRINITY_DN28546_c0_g2~~TRINITY_DN28546_c0_g2_i1.p1  ORF type:complete len:509 (-),score=102.73 TRINITY_DN28546_c0_g2_i1:80-1606(-)